MPTRTPAPAAVPRLTYLRIKNYRALRDVEFRDLTPLTVLIGPNGSGKSTVLDALDFLAEAVRGNLTGAWEKRNRFAGMRTRGSEGNIEFELQIHLSQETVINYKLEVEEKDGKITVNNEVSTLLGKIDKRIKYKVERENPEEIYVPADTSGGFLLTQNPRNIYGSDLIGLSLGTSALNPALYFIGLFKDEREKLGKYEVPLANFLQSYRYIHLTDDHLKGYSDAGPREKLSPNGDNLPNVLYYLHTKHPEVLEKITAQLRRWVPGLADIVMESTSDERLLLRFKDAPFEKPLPAQYMSAGTMRLAALLTLLYEPGATGLLGLEEPENELHPQLLAYLAEELIAATDTRQLLVATHSPALLNALAPEQVWILHRGADGYTQATRTADLPGISAMVEEGTPLGYLWSRNFFDVGNPMDLPVPVK